MAATSVEELLVQSISFRSADGITAAVVELVEAGRLEPGTRLPTVRRLASRLSVSPSTVAQSWDALTRQGMIEGRRRAGTFVKGTSGYPRASRLQSLLSPPISGVRDHANALPDPYLLPELPDTSSIYAKQQWHRRTSPLAITDRLTNSLKCFWDTSGILFVATHGVISALQLSIEALVQPGDLVAIETPSHPRVLEHLDSIGIHAVWVPRREDGPDLEALRSAIGRNPRVFIYQPSIHSPTGTVLQPNWIGEASKILANQPTKILEFDHFSSLLGAPSISLQETFTDRTLTTRSFAFSFGRGVGLSIVAGPPDLIEKVWLAQSYSQGWVPDLLQDTLAFLLQDPATQQQLHRARQIYWQRHENFRWRLAEHGISTQSSHPPSVWVPVHSQTQAVQSLQEAGIFAHGGSLFDPDPQAAPHVHISSSRLPLTISGVAQVAMDVAAAASLGT